MIGRAVELAQRTWRKTIRKTAARLYDSGNKTVGEVIPLCSRLTIICDIPANEMAPFIDNLAMDSGSNVQDLAELLKSIRLLSKHLDAAEEFCEKNGFSKVADLNHQDVVAMAEELKLQKSMRKRLINAIRDLKRTKARGRRQRWPQ